MNPPMDNNVHTNTSKHTNGVPIERGTVGQPNPELLTMVVGLAASEWLPRYPVEKQATACTSLGEGDICITVQ